METIDKAKVFEGLSSALKKSITEAVRNNSDTVSFNGSWLHRLDAEAQSLLGAEGSPFTGAAYEIAASGKYDNFPCYILDDDIVELLS